MYLKSGNVQKGEALAQQGVAITPEMLECDFSIIGYLFRLLCILLIKWQIEATQLPLPFAKKIDEILLQAWQILTDQPGVIDPITTLRLQTRRANRGAGLRSRVSIIDCCFAGYCSIDTIINEIIESFFSRSIHIS